MIDFPGLGVLGLGRDGRVVHASPGAIELLGEPPDRVFGAHWGRLLLSATNPDRGSSEGIPTGAPLERFLTDGRRRIRCTVRATGADADLTHVVLVEDVTEAHAARRARAALLELEVKVLRKEPLSDFFHHFCHRVADVFGVPLVWVGSCESDGSIAIRGRAGAASGHLDELRLRRADAAEGGGPIGRSVRERIPIMGDLATAQDPSPRAIGAGPEGLSSVLSIPLLVGDHPIGALVLHGSREAGLSERNEDLTAFANLAALALHQGLHLSQCWLLETALDAIRAAVYIADAEGRFRWVNRGFHELTGYRADEVVGQSMDLLKTAVEANSHRRTMEGVLERVGVWSGETYNRASDGAVYHAHESVRAVCGPDGRIVHLVGTQTDLSERLEHEERIRHMLEYDTLTRLPNRRALESELARQMAGAGSMPGTLVMLDIDHFSVVNDVLGPAGGDRILTEVAGVMRAALPASDMLARWGGDEFSAIMNASVEEATQRVDRLQRAVIGHRVDLGGHPFGMSVTAGVVGFTPENDPSRVLASADAALYAARDLGPGRRWVVSSSDVEPGLRRQGNWAARLQDALERDRLVLFFQPVVRLGDGETTHFEALIRLRDEEGAFILPGSFIPAAERFGIMPRVDAWVLRRAVHLLEENPQANLFVNISRVGLNDLDHLNRLECILDEAALDPGRITLEITETSVLQDPKATRLWMSRLRERGCRFALDDFGKGFSTFGYLSDLPVDYVKIDGSFVRNVATDSKSRAMFEAMATMAQALGKEVVAECVEDAPTAGLLRELDIEYGQGYHWGPPGLRLVSP